MSVVVRQEPSNGWTPPAPAVTARPLSGRERMEHERERERRESDDDAQRFEGR